MDMKNLKRCSDDRIGEAYVMMNCFEWDDLFGPKPLGFDKMTDNEKYRNPQFREAMCYIYSRLTYAQMSKYWWTLKLKRSPEDWSDWYRKSFSKEGLK